MAKPTCRALHSLVKLSQESRWSFRYTVILQRRHATNERIYNDRSNLQSAVSDIHKSKLDAYVHVFRQISSPLYGAILAAVYIQLELDLHSLSVHHEKPREWYRDRRIHRQNDSIIMSYSISNLHQQHKWNSLLNHFRLHLF